MTTATAVTQEKTKLDVLSLGEVVVDLISRHKVTSLADAREFSRFLGGQVTNVALNVTRLGGQAAVVACVGEDGFGVFVREQLSAAGVTSEYVQVTSLAPTTTIIPSRQTETPDFIVHRGSDAFITLTPAIEHVIQQARFVHTSAFAISRDPARTTILMALQIAKGAGCRVSLDPNYHPRIWPDVDNLPEVLATTCRLVDVVKPSLDDCIRLFGPNKSPFEYVERFLEWGVAIVVLTMGREGAIVATDQGGFFHIQPEEVEVMDVTGAGDAFWGGFLLALLDGLPPEDAACVGQLVAEIKIRAVGPLPGPLDRAALYRELESNKQHVMIRIQ